MKMIEIWVEGNQPGMLMHRATEENLSGGDGTRLNAAGEKKDPREICNEAVYRIPNDGNQLALPGAAFARMLREAGGSHKLKGTRKSLKYVIPAAVLILDDLCPLFLRDRKTPCIDFEVDARPVTIPSTKGRVMRYRARLNEWTSRVTLRLNDQILSEEIVRRMFGEGLAQIGVGDFRPEKGGPFGTASIVSWLNIGDAKPLTSAQQRNAGLEPVSRA